MLIYELEIGFKSNNILQISVECVDEADAKDTFVGLINDLTMTDSGGYLLEHDRGLATFSVKDVEYITWKQILDTYTPPKPAHKVGTWFNTWMEELDDFPNTTSSE